MLTGERRWLSARRGGTTVSGKVTVPKPINLPSQRLENHGLDPNVEIVPKGTLNWGARSSSSAQNAWASPAQSPPKFGGTDSHLNDRPSSAGSRTRPSTAGSDRSHETVPNVWGPSSRPSSASGVLTSNQTSVVARPRSAEPRPASSQLSRFAEPISETSVTWGTSGTLEKVGALSSKSKDFSLSSGDFPTLRSEKTTETLVRQGNSSHGRPGSASGRAATPKQIPESSPSEDGSIYASKEGDVNTLRNDNILQFDSGDPPSIERWQREMIPYSDQNMPQHFGLWHGNPPHNPPNGVWYRGPFGGPPYAPPGPPGGYPHEQFAYYHTGHPARPAANLQPVRQPGSAPRGYFPDKGDSHRPRMPDSYIPPVMPFGPGPYPVQVPYDGYYGPPRVNSCVSGERMVPVMGMATAPCVYNRYPIQNATYDAEKFVESSEYGPRNTRAIEQGGSGHPHGIHQGPYKVLLKHQDGWDESGHQDKREHAGSKPFPQRGNPSGIVTREVGQGGDLRHDDQVNVSKILTVAACSQYVDNHGCYSPGPVGLDLEERTTKITRVDDNLLREPEAASVPGGDQRVLSTKRTPTLIEKIESLNHKAHMADGRYDENSKSLKALSSRADYAPNEADYAPNEADSNTNTRNKAPSSGTPSDPAPAVEMYPSGDQKREAFTGANASRSVHDPHTSIQRFLSSSGSGMVHRSLQKRPHGVQGRTEDRGKGKPNHLKDEAWRKKSLVTDFSAEGSSKKGEAYDDNALDHHAVLGASEKSRGDLSASDPSNVQRAKMRELVAERAKRLQKEEEERTKEQKARALAKLEELNRRTIADISTEVDHTSQESAPPQHKQESSQFTAGLMTASTSSEVTCSASGWDCDTFNPPVDYVTNGHEEFTDLPKKGALEAPICVEHAPNISKSPCLPLPLEVETKDVTDDKTSQAGDSSVLKQKQVGNKRKQNKNVNDKVISSGVSGHVKSHDVVGDVNSLSGELNSHINANKSDDSLLKHKKKSRGKNKHRVDEVSSGTQSPKVVSMDSNSLKRSAESSKLKTSISVFEVGSVQVPFSVEVAEAENSVVVSNDQGCSKSTEEVPSVVNYQLKPHPRRMLKNTQGTRVAEKFHGTEAVVWAPVGSLKKKEDSGDVPLHSTTEVHTSSMIGRGSQTNHKSRRAEVERYVPKPVAKEAKEPSVQGNTNQPLFSPVEQDAASGSTGRAEPIASNREISGPDGLSCGKGGLPPASKIGESKPNKHGKAHGLWRPRNLGESPLIQPSLEESSNSSGPTKTVKKSFEQPPKADIRLQKEQAEFPDNLNASKTPSSSEPLTDSDKKDHGVPNRGKRQPSKGHKGRGNVQNNSEHGLHGRETFEAGLESSLESNKLDARRISVGEKPAIDAHTPSHWQAKSQVHMAQDHLGSSKASGGESVSNRVGKAPRKEYPVQGVEQLVSNANKGNSQFMRQPHSDRSNESNIHQGTKPGRKSVNSRKQDPHFTHQHPANPVKLKDPPDNSNNYIEKSIPMLQRHGNQSDFGHGAQNTVVQDSSKQEAPPLSDRRRHASHYEYQRTSRYDDNEPIESFEEGPCITSLRYRERGQTQTRRGGVNSYACNSGTHRMTAACSNWEHNP